MRSASGFLSLNPAPPGDGVRILAACDSRRAVSSPVTSPPSPLIAITARFLGVCGKLLLIARLNNSHTHEKRPKSACETEGGGGGG